MEEAPPAGGAVRFTLLHDWKGICRRQQVVSGKWPSDLELGFGAPNTHVNTDHASAKQQGACGVLLKKVSLEEWLKEVMLEIGLKEELEE